MKVLIGEDGFDRNPHDISVDGWYYEEKSGLRMYYRGECIGTIKPRSLRAYIARADKQKNKVSKKKPVK